MSKYLKNVTVTTEFDGDQVTIVLRPLKLEDLIRHRKARQKKDEPPPPDTTEAIEADIAMKRMVREYVVSIVGLKDAAGVELSVDEIFDASYFVNLVAFITGALYTNAFPASPK